MGHGTGRDRVTLRRLAALAAALLCIAGTGRSASSIAWASPRGCSPSPRDCTAAPPPNTDLALSSGGDLVLYGLAPRYRLLEREHFALDAALTISIASKLSPVGASRRATVQPLGFGLNLRYQPGGGPLELEVEPGLDWIERDAYGLVGGVGTPTQHPAATAALPHLATGLRLRL